MVWKRKSCEKIGRLIGSRSKSVIFPLNFRISAQRTFVRNIVRNWARRIPRNIRKICSLALLSTASQVFCLKIQNSNLTGLQERLKVFDSFSPYFYTEFNGIHQNIVTVVSHYSASLNRQVSSSLLPQMVRPGMKEVAADCPFNIFNFCDFFFTRLLCWCHFSRSNA